MTLRRMRRKIRQHRSKLFVALGIIVVVAILVFLLTAVQLPVKKTMYELTEVDVLAVKDLRGDQVTLKGVALGDTQQKVLDTLGFPDTQTIYNPDITNMEFGKAFSLNKTGVILQFKGDALKKITLLPVFNEFLKGSTKIEYTKDEFLITHGKPEEVKQIQESPTSVSVIRLYTYKEGIQFSTKRGIQIALSFIKPIE